MDELRKGIWNEAMWKAIGTFFSKYPNLTLPLTITCIDLSEGTPIHESESGRIKMHTRLFHLLVEDKNGSPAWNENYYPEVFKGGPVVFLVSKGEDCYDLKLDLRFPGDYEKPVTEGETAAVV